ncbi:MAG: cupin domain-containing protein [Myxococcota bacterium]
MDVLADVLRVSALGNSILNRSELVAPWGLQVGAEVQAAVHIVQRGLCWFRVGRKPPVRMGPGDLVLIPRGTVHSLQDDPRTPVEPFAVALRRQAKASRRKLTNQDQSTTLVCAEIKFEHIDPHPLMTILPDVIHLPAVATDDHGLMTVTRLLLREALAQRMGADLVVPRLIDTLLVFVVRSWLEQQPLESAGWLGALRDAQIGRALALIHDAPAHKWSINELAAKTAVSRATFARRFVGLVGESPHAYVTRWRMNLAARLLRSTLESAESIAAQVGYESPTAFGAAFRRHFSLSPGQYRKRASAIPRGR